MFASRVRRRASLPALSSLFAAVAVAPALGNVHCSSDEGEAPVALPACTSDTFEGAPLGVRCNALVDQEGRTVFLHGINARVEGLFDVSFDDGREPLHLVPDFTAADATRIRELGYNAVRLPINWSGIEPTETGGFRAEYMTRLRQIADFCQSAGLYVLLSVHQDAYSKEIGQDGAPLWAIKPPPTKLLGGPLTNMDERILSKQVNDAFATFFGDSDDGTYLRDRFTKMVAFVMSELAEHPAILGVDVFNEPVATDAQVRRLYQQVHAAVQRVAPKKLVMFQPPGIRNLVDFAPVGNGSLGPGTVYAPHVYTGVFAGSEQRRLNITRDSLIPSNEAARAEADSWNSPLVVGEYGFYPRLPNFGDYIRWQNELQEEYLASEFLWVWKEFSQDNWGYYDYDESTRVWTERPAVVDALARIRVERIAGRVGSVRYDRDAKALTVRFVGQSDARGEHVVSIGAVAGAVSATCDGKSVAARREGATVNVVCEGDGPHTLVVRAGG